MLALEAAYAFLLKDKEKLNDVEYALLQEALKEVALLSEADSNNPKMSVSEYLQAKNKKLADKFERIKSPFSYIELEWRLTCRLQLLDILSCLLDIEALAIKQYPQLKITTIKSLQQSVDNLQKIYLKLNSLPPSAAPEKNLLANLLGFEIKAAPKNKPAMPLLKSLLKILDKLASHHYLDVKSLKDYLNDTKEMLSYYIFECKNNKNAFIELTQQGLLDTFQAITAFHNWLNWMTTSTQTSRQPQYLQEHLLQSKHWLKHQKSHWEKYCKRVVA